MPHGPEAGSPLRKKGKGLGDVCPLTMTQMILYTIVRILSLMTRTPSTRPRVNGATGFHVLEPLKRTPQGGHMSYSSRAFRTAAAS